MNWRHFALVLATFLAVATKDMKNTKDTKDANK